MNDGILPYMEVDMELPKKTTILFSTQLHQYLVKLAKQQGVSLGHLVRRACEEMYGYVSKEDRLRAVEEMHGLSLPVGDAEQMERESVPDPWEPLA